MQVVYVLYIDISSICGIDRYKWDTYHIWKACILLSKERNIESYLKQSEDL